MDLGRTFRGGLGNRDKNRSAPVPAPAISQPVVQPVTISVTGALRLPNRDRLERIGSYLAVRNAQFVCISELEEGYLLVYKRSTTQVVETLTYTDVAALPAAHSLSLATMLPQQLAAIGRYLDRNHALSTLVDQQAGGYYLEYAAPPANAHTAANLSRVSRFLDANALRNLMLPTGMLPTGRL